MYTDMYKDMYTVHVNIPTYVYIGMYVFIVYVNNEMCRYAYGHISVFMYVVQRRSPDVFKCPYDVHSILIIQYSISNIQNM